jgi:enoyl-CoA hydratase/carnithine racemase
VSDRVLAALEGGILTATLNRPEKKNAIDTPMIDALLALLERADLDGRYASWRCAAPEATSAPAWT